MGGVNKRITWYIIGLSALSLLTACSPNEIALNEVRTIINQSELKPYVQQVSVDVSKKDYDTYPVTINLGLKNSFMNLDTAKQYYTIANTVKKFENLKDPSCSTCDYSELKANNGNTSFEMTIIKDDKELGELGIYNKSEPLKEPDVYFEENFKDTSTSPSSNVSDNTNFKQEVHNYMKELYNKITNYGENYIPERDDPKVAKLASKHFGISAKEAGDIYAEVEFAQANK